MYIENLILNFLLLLLLAQSACCHGVVYCTRALSGLSEFHWIFSRSALFNSWLLSFVYIYLLTDAVELDCFVPPCKRCLPTNHVWQKAATLELPTSSNIHALEPSTLLTQTPRLRSAPLPNIPTKGSTQNGNRRRTLPPIEPISPMVLWAGNPAGAARQDQWRGQAANLGAPQHRQPPRVPNNGRGEATRQVLHD